MPPRHKRVDSDSLTTPWVDVSAPTLEAQSQALFSPCSLNHSSPGLARSGKALGGFKDNGLALNCATNATSQQGGDEGPSSHTCQESLMRYKGVRVKVRATATHVSWKPVNNHSGCCLDPRALACSIPYDEVLSAWVLPKSTACCCPRENAFTVYAVSRRARDPNTWTVEEHMLTAPTAEHQKDWVNMINGAVLALRDRPRNLLVFVNPFSGAKRARQVWERDVLPVLQKARIKYTLIETTKQDHAKEYVATMKADELAAFHGVLAVGGDGMFQEVVTGLHAQRARGGANAAASHRIRLGHVPAGSTDAVAYSMHGSRCAVTAALHVALGDRLSLDVGRVESEGGGWKHFVCQAGYGFMGDVMRFSEKLRCLGPSRYDVTGALQFLRLASYRIAVSYREASSTVADVQQLCTVKCEVCRMAGLCMDTSGMYARRSSNPNGGSGAASAAGASAAGTPRVQPLFGMPASSTSAAASAGAGAQQGASAAGAGMGAGSAAQQPQLEKQASADVGVAAPSCGLHAAISRTSLGDAPPASPKPALGSAAAAAAAAGEQAGSAPKAAPLQSAASGGPPTPSRTGSGNMAVQQGEDGWTHVEGDFMSVMCVVTPCRSDKSKKGIIPNGHLSDGRMYLVLVSKCNHLSYLRFLIRLSTRGLVDRCLPFVRVIPISELQLKPLPGGGTLGGYLGGGDGCHESCWNVDGELLRHNHVRVLVNRGAVEVFARGLELAAPRSL